MKQLYKVKQLIGINNPHLFQQQDDDTSLTQKNVAGRETLGNNVVAVEIC